MSNHRQRPVSNPQKFISSMFDLAYGARDGSEPLTPGEIKAQLQEAGIDPDAAWKRFSVMLHAPAKLESLAEARRKRLAAPIPPAVAQPKRSRASLLEELQRLLATLEPNVGAVFGRRWEDNTDEDLAAVCSQLQRQIDRSKADER